MTGMDEVADPAVRALIAAINGGDRAAFFDALTPGATMSDDGTDRDLAAWADREIFTVHGHMEVVSAADQGGPWSRTTATTRGGRCAPDGRSR
jgi:hypothetical protein